MYYKVIKDNKVIDVLDKLIYCKYQPKHKIMVLCDVTEAQAVLSSDQGTAWHVKGYYKIPVDGYDTVTLQQIDCYEYRSLKALCMKTPESIIDEFVLSLISEGVL